MRNLNVKNQNGRSMIEMLGVLAIIGVLSVGGIAGYSKAMMKYRINKTIEQITLIAGNVRSFFGPQKNYTGITCWGSSTYVRSSSMETDCPIIKKAKILPDEMITVTDGKIMSITTPFGLGFGLGTANKAKSGDNKAFIITYNIRDMEACIELVTNDWSNANVAAIETNGMKGRETSKTPVDLDKAIKICEKDNEQTAATDGIHFYFDIDVNSAYWQDIIK